MLVFITVLLAVFSFPSILCDPQRLSKLGCGGPSKFCILLPSSCDPQIAGSCSTAVTITPAPDNPEAVDIMMHRTLPDFTNPYYIAVGFSEDKRMGDDAVTHCINNPSLESYLQIQFGVSSNIGRSNVVLPDSEWDVRPIQSGVIGNEFICHVRREIGTLTKPYHLLLATGTASTDNTLNYHAGTRYASDETVQLKKLTSEKTCK